jgi:hypothetical protein
VPAFNLFCYLIDFKKITGFPCAAGILYQSFRPKIAANMMTLVLQTTVGTIPETDSAIQEVLSRYGIYEQDTPVSFGVDTFSYYSVDSGVDAQPLIRELMQLPAIAAAYIKPQGVPPL